MKFGIAVFAVLIALVFVLAGCAPADCLFPLYKATDTATDDRLVGKWQLVGKDLSDSEKDQRWSFKPRKDGKSYEFTLGADQAKGGFAAVVHLVGIGNDLLVDFEGDFDRINPDDKMDDLMPYPAIATHAIGRIWIDQDAVRIHFLKDEWAKDQMNAGTLTLAHVNVGGYPLITATTDELRSFMQAHAEDNDALSENYELKRIK